MMKIFCKLLIFSVLLLKTTAVFSQDDFLFKRKINFTNEKNDWNYLPIPDEFYANESKHLSGVRIFKINEKDTTEIPFLVFRENISEENIEIASKIINVSKSEKGYYFTMENLDNQQDINQIFLHFDNKNFDWKIDLQGSHTQNEWFSILENYRILSIENSQAEYRFEKLVFPNSNYKYYRILVKNAENPKLKTASFGFYSAKIQNKLKEYNISDFVLKNDEKNKITTIDISLSKPILLYSAEIQVDNLKNYHRSVRIELVDSLQTQKGVIPSYSFFDAEFISSLEQPIFKNDDSPVVAKNIRITIENNNDKPLKIRNIKLYSLPQGVVFETEGKGDYYLFYGSKTAYSPEYDLEKFRTQVIENQKDTLSLSEEIFIKKQEKNTEKPIFENKMWLWVVMLLIITLLGYFSLKLLPKKE